MLRRSTFSCWFTFFSNSKKVVSFRLLNCMHVLHIRWAPSQAALRLTHFELTFIVDGNSLPDLQCTQLDSM